MRAACSAEMIFSAVHRSISENGKRDCLLMRLSGKVHFPSGPNMPGGQIYFASTDIAGVHSTFSQKRWANESVHHLLVVSAPMLGRTSALNARDVLAHRPRPARLPAKPEAARPGNQGLDGRDRGSCPPETAENHEVTGHQHRHDPERHKGQRQAAHLGHRAGPCEIEPAT